MKINEFLTEAAKDPFRKYPHIEDLVLKQGSHGGLHAIERLRDMTAVGGSLEVKWDGMPVVYWGRDEQGNFSMIPKNAWAYLKDGKTETSSGAPTVMRSPQDVKSFVMGTGDANPNDKKRVKFANQFASLWPYFEKISPKQGYLEGGLLFYPGTKPDGKTAMPVLNPETNKYDFQPNISGFHIPADSDLGKKIAKSKVMVAATGYYPTMGSSDEQRFPNAESLSVPGVIVQGTTYVQEPVPIDTTGLDSLDEFVKKNAKLIDNYLAPKPGLSNPGGELYTYFNKHLRTEGLLADFPEWAKSNLSEKKAQTMLADVEGLKATLGAVEGIAKEKLRLKKQADTVSHGGINQTKPEGYAQAHPGRKFQYDMPGQFVKVVDQSDWAPKESVVNEGKKGSGAVLGWGRGMGHTGHDALVKAVIHQAESTGAKPYFVVSRSFGKDDPIPPEAKVKMYQKKFPKYAKMFSLPTAEAPTLNDVLANLATKGITDVTLVVGADQKNAFGYLTKPDKSGVPPYKNFGLNSLTVMSRQDTKEPSSDVNSPDYHEGPRATPMREILLDPNKTEQEQFAVWRQAMSPALDDKEVLDMMNTAKKNLIQFHTPKPRRKASKIKEQITKMRPLLKEATVEQQYRMLKLMKEAYELQEVFDTKASTATSQWDTSDPDMIKFNFTASNGVEYQLDFLEPYIGPENMSPYDYVDSDEVYENSKFVSFEQITQDMKGGYPVVKQGIEGTGAAAEVFGIVVNAIVQYVKKFKPSLLYFQAAEPGRRALYARMIKRVLPSLPGWKSQTNGNGEFGVYNTKKVKNAMPVQEKMKMGATIEPIEEEKEIDPVKTVIKFYEPIVNDIHKEKIDDYVDKARTLLQQTDDPAVRAKLIDIFKKGKENPYIQGGIITTVGALLAGGLLSSASKMGLSPSQTNILLQSVLNTVIPTLVSRINGKSWIDTLKYTLASAGIGTSIAALTEKDSDVIGHVANDLTTGAPIAKLRAARDAEQMKKREQDYGHPESPTFDDYLDEK